MQKTTIFALIFEIHFGNHHQRQRGKKETGVFCKNKKKLNYDLKVWEAMEIKKANCGPGRGLNEDWGAYVKTDAWNPVFNTMD